MTAPPPRVSVVVVSFNTREYLLRCLASLQAAVLPLQVLVVDNASSDGSADAVADRFPRARLLRNAENAGFGRACNQALALAEGPYVLFLNSDAEVRAGAIEAMAALLDRRADVVAVGPRVRDGDGQVEVSFGGPLTPYREWRQRRLVQRVQQRQLDAMREAEGRAATEHEPAWVSASCLMARRDALRAIGGFDEGFFLYEEDVDLCQRLRKAGGRTLFTPAAEVVHHRGRSMESVPARARLEYHRSHLRYYRKHNGRLATLALRGWLLARGMVRLAITGR